MHPVYTLKLIQRSRSRVLALRLLENAPCCSYLLPNSSYVSISTAVTVEGCCVISICNTIDFASG